MKQSCVSPNRSAALPPGAYSGEIDQVFRAMAIAHSEHGDHLGPTSEVQSEVTRIQTSYTHSVMQGKRGMGFSHRVSFQFQTICVVHQPV